MIVKMVQMNPLNSVKESTVSALSQNSDAAMANVYQVDGDVTTKTIVVMAQTNSHAKTLNAKMAPSNVLLDIVLLRTLGVTAIVIVGICRTSLIVLHDSQGVAIVPNPSSNVRITCVCRQWISVMARTIAETILMRPQKSVVTLIATHSEDSNVITTDVSRNTNCVMALIIVVMAVMKMIWLCVRLRLNHVIQQVSSSVPTRNVSNERNSVTLPMIAAICPMNWDAIIMHIVTSKHVAAVNTLALI